MEGSLSGFDKFPLSVSGGVTLRTCMVKAQGILIFLSELWIPPVLVLLQFILADIKHSSRVIHRVEHSGGGEMKTSDTQFDH